MDTPNILFFCTDQHRGDWLPLAASALAAMDSEPLALDMPNLKALMDNGVTFTRAVTSSPICAPARGCMASGRRYHRANVPNGRSALPMGQTTYYQVLRNAGYHMAGVGKFHLRGAQFNWGPPPFDGSFTDIGFDDVVETGGRMTPLRKECRDNPATYNAYWADLAKAGYADLLLQEICDVMKGYQHNRRAPMESMQFPDMDAKPNVRTELGDWEAHGCIISRVPVELHPDDWIADRAVERLQTMPTDKPWHLYVSLEGPHGPWVVSEETYEKVKDREFPLSHARDPFHTPETQQDIRRFYAGMLENIDAQIGKVLTALKERGDWENTIIFYTADHGESLGDWGRYGKVRAHRSSVHIPMIASGPGIQRGVCSDALIELQDISGTILDYGGARILDEMDARSFRPVLQGDSETHRDYQLSAYGFQSICDGRHRLIRNPDETKLIDTIEDPWENHNLAEIHPDLVKELSARLEQEMSTTVAV